jgi:succinate-acetate transporter protein
MAVGNTFGATALSSYGGFWIAYAILLSPQWNITGPGGPYATEATKAIDPKMVDSAIGLFLTGWFIFTTILLLCTLRSTVMFFLLFFTLDVAFLMLACGHYASDNGAVDSAKRLTQAGGGFGMIAAFLAWYNAFAGIADSRYVLSLGFFSRFRSWPPSSLWTLVVASFLPPPGLAPGGMSVGCMSQADPWHATSVTQENAQLLPSLSRRNGWIG